MTKTIQIDDKLHQKLKVEATQKGMLLRDLIKEKLS
jgi:predicted HicB family RNase H-like nuclease